MITHHHGARILGTEPFLHHPPPVAPSSAKLCYLFQYVGESIIEKGKARGKGVDLHTPINARLYIGDAVGNGKGHLLGCRGACLANVIATNTDGVPPGHMLVTEFDEIHSETHGGVGWIDILTSANNLFEYVILHGATHFAIRDTLFLSKGQIHCQKHCRWRINGHGGGNFIQGYLAKENSHVINGINGHSHLANLSHRKFMIRVVAGLSWQVEGDAKPGLTLFKQIAISFIGLPRCAESSILTHGPEPASIHGGLHPPGERILTRKTKLGIIIKVGDI